MNLKDARVLAISAMVVISIGILLWIPLPMRLVQYDDLALARLDLEPLYRQIETYRAAHGGHYPHRLQDLEFQPSYVTFHENIDYVRPGSAEIEASNILCVLRVAELKKRRTLLGVMTKTIPHHFALRADGSVVELQSAK